MTDDNLALWDLEMQRQRLELISREIAAAWNACLCMVLLLCAGVVWL